MSNAFRKIARVRTLTGGLTWYLNEDCLLAAKRSMYAVEYRRVYLRDLESVVIWRNGSWLWRLIIPGVLFAALGALFWGLSSTFGTILVGVGLAWAALELALGPTAKSSIRITGATLDLPLVMRTRRAPKVLAKLDAAIRVSRGLEAPATPAMVTTPAGPPSQTPDASATASVAAATQTNAS